MPDPNANGANTGGNAGAVTIRSGDRTNGGGEDSVTLSGDISAQGGNSTDATQVGLNDKIIIDTSVLITTDNRTITTERTRAGIVNQGDITIEDDANGTNLAQIALGGGLVLSAGDNDDVNFIASVDYDGIAAGTGTLALNAGNNVNIVSDITDSNTGTTDSLSVSLNANTDDDTNGDVILNGFQNSNININTGGGTYNVTAVNYDGDSTTDRKTTIDTGVGRADIKVTGIASLEEMNVGGNLNVEADTADGNGNSISQGTAGASDDTLTVAGAASFTSNDGNIDLANSNNLQGAIALAAVGLTVNAGQDLTLANNVTVGGTAQLNFGQGNQGNTASTFTAQSGITYTAAAASTITGSTANDIFDLAANITGVIDGGTGNDTFNINSTVDASLNGGDGNDIFNVGNVGADNLSASIKGGNGGTDLDRVVGVDSAVTTAWDMTGNELGNMSNSNGLNVSFSEIEDLVGGTGVDQFTVDSGVSIGTISGAGNDDLFTVNGTVSALNGDAGNDTIKLVGAGSVTGLIDGGDSAQDGGDSVDMSARTGPFSVELGADVVNVEQITGNDTDSTLIGTLDPNTFILSGENDGSADGVNFTDFNNLNGGDGDDTFKVQTGGTCSPGSLMVAQAVTAWK